MIPNKDHEEGATSNPIVIVSTIRFENGVEVAGLMKITIDVFCNFEEGSVRVSYGDRSWFVVGSGCFLKELDSTS